jgi:hypothetical protein
MLENPDPDGLNEITQTEFLESDHQDLGLHREIIHDAADRSYSVSIIYLSSNMAWRKKSTETKREGTDPFRIPRPSGLDNSIY